MCSLTVEKERAAGVFQGMLPRDRAGEEEARPDPFPSQDPIYLVLGKVFQRGACGRGHGDRLGSSTLVNAVALQKAIRVRIELKPGIEVQHRG